MTDSGITVDKNAIHLKHVEKSFGSNETKTKVLIDINISLPFGELILISGPSGCGKTTLISVLSGILNADQGEIYLFGESLHEMNDSKKTDFRKDYVGFIFQQFNLVPTLTITENVAIPLLILGLKAKQANQAARDMLALVGLEKRLDYYPNQLSGGQQQRVAIARALVRQPRLLICDEPTASLDAVSGQQVMELLRSTALQNDRCVLVVTHDSRIYDFGDRMVVMDDGQISDNYPIQSAKKKA